MNSEGLQIAQTEHNSINQDDKCTVKVEIAQQDNKKALEKSELNKLRDENSNQNELSKTENFPVPINNANDPHFKPLKKNGFMLNIFDRLSHSTPKLFSKNKKHKKSKSDLTKNLDSVSLDKTNNVNKLSENKLSYSIDGKNFNQFSPRSKSIRKMLLKLTRKKEKNKFISEPPSTIESRPSLSSVGNHGLQYDTVKSEKDIYLNKLIKNPLDNVNCSSADCILEIQKIRKAKENNADSAFNTSQDIDGYAVKLTSGVESNSPDTGSDDFLGAEVPIQKGNEKKFLSLLQIDTNQSKFDSQRSCRSTTLSGTQNPDKSNSLKLTLALYGYGSPGFRSSYLKSKSCMELLMPNPVKKSDTLSIENGPRITISQAQPKAPIGSVECDQEPKVNGQIPIDIVDEQKAVEGSGDCGDVTDNCVVKAKTSESEENTEQSQPSVVLRKFHRPNDIKLRRSREPSQNMVATRSSLIMLMVSQNSPRSRPGTDQLFTPNKDMEIAGLSIYQTGKLNLNDTAVEIGKEEERKSLNLPSCVEINENGFIDHQQNQNHQSSEIVEDGHYFLNLVYKNEKEIQTKIDIVQKYINEHEQELDDEVMGQFMVSIGKAKLLLCEKMLQFKGLCEKNIRGIIEENELPTLSSDLNGFWDMVYGQIEDINRNFVLVEKIKDNDWKMIVSVDQKPVTNNSKSSVSQTRKSSTPSKKVSTGSAGAGKSAQTKANIAEKRKNMMQFKMNQKAAMAQKQDSSATDDIIFY